MMLNNLKVCIIDFGGGNTRSVYNIFNAMGVSAVLSSKENDIKDASHIVLPGVGAFGTVMDKLHKSGLIPLLEKYVLQEGKPFMGICIGMQILAEKGFEFGEWNGLGWIPGIVEKMDAGNNVLPHMGWNNLTITNSCSLLDRIGSNIDFYFVHSNYFNTGDKSNICATFDYGNVFTAVIQRENIFGVQFHPEKSQKAGKILLNNFLKI